MQQLVCRDCGLLIPTSARGCPRCALNLEAEKKIDRVVWWVIVPLVIVLLILLAGTAVYLLR
jgi:hypothetical protein